MAIRHGKFDVRAPALPGFTFNRSRLGLSQPMRHAHQPPCRVPSLRQPGDRRHKPGHMSGSPAFEEAEQLRLPHTQATGERRKHHGAQQRQWGTACGRDDHRGVPDGHAHTVGGDERA